MIAIVALYFPDLKMRSRRGPRPGTFGADVSLHERIALARMERRTYGHSLQCRSHINLHANPRPVKSRDAIHQLYFTIRGLTLARHELMRYSNMAGGHGPAAGGHGGHPIHIHPARPLYRFAATGLGAAMWFFVRYYGLLAI
jgi:hypothetical protein